MRSVVQEDSTVGLLLFDEPSAALDLAAEHGQSNLTRIKTRLTGAIWSSSRLIQPVAGTQGKQNNDLLIASVREPDQTRGYDPVSACVIKFVSCLTDVTIDIWTNLSSSNREITKSC